MAQNTDLTDNNDNISRINDNISRINDNINNIHHTMNIMSNSLLMTQMNDLRRTRAYTPPTPRYRNPLYSFSIPVPQTNSTSIPQDPPTQPINPLSQNVPMTQTNPLTEQTTPSTRSRDAMTSFLTSLITNELPTVGLGSMEISVLGLNRDRDSSDEENIVISHLNISENTEIYAKKYDEDVSESDFEKCSICLEPINENDIVREIKKCKHSFHIKCIDEWFQNNIKCPNCNQDIRIELEN